MDASKGTPGDAITGLFSGGLDSFFSFLHECLGLNVFPCVVGEPTAPDGTADGAARALVVVLDFLNVFVAGSVLMLALTAFTMQPVLAMALLGIAVGALSVAIGCAGDYLADGTLSSSCAISVALFAGALVLPFNPWGAAVLVGLSFYTLWNDLLGCSV